MIFPHVEVFHVKKVLIFVFFAGYMLDPILIALERKGLFTALLIYWIYAFPTWMNLENLCLISPSVHGGGDPSNSIVR